MLCGLPGAGKTVLAKRLENDMAAIRFSVDEWMIRLYGHHMPRELLHERLGVIKELLWTVAERAVELERKVILDFGFWKRDERLLFAQRALEVGGEPVLYYLEEPLPVLHERLAVRNRDLPPNTYAVTSEMLEMFAGWFEPPGDDEGFRVVRP
jgi:predicted kinase